MRLIAADDMGGMTMTRGVAHGQSCFLGFSECLLDLLLRVRPSLHDQILRTDVDNVNDTRDVDPSDH